MKAIFLLILLPVMLSAQSIHSDKTGDELLSLLVQDYKPGQVLTYAMARDTMYLNIYRNEDNDVECHYSGHTVNLPDGVNPRFHLAMDGDADGINTEHIYPQSKGAGSGNARADMHHLVPTRWAVNAARSNYPFAEIDDDDTDRWFYKSDDLTEIPTSNIDNYSERLNGAFGPGEFEPRESVKGDVARAVFYFYTMYQEEGDNEDSDFFSSMLPTLIDWHYLDPADPYELEVTMKKADYQEGKPNPYILDCTLVSRAFGGDGSCETVSTDELHDYGKPYVYPNPVHNAISIKGMNYDADQIKIFTIEGEHLQTINEIPYNWIDVSGYMDGQYILSLYKEGTRIQSMKFVKM